MCLAREKRPPAYGLPLLAGFFLNQVRWSSEICSVRMPTEYAPTARAMTGVWSVSRRLPDDGAKEVTAQTDKIEFKVLKIVLKKAIMTADDGFISCSETTSSVTICFKLLPKAMHVIILW